MQAPTSWEDKPDEISQSNWDNMESVYTNVEDIDAFTGAISEIPVHIGNPWVLSQDGQSGVAVAGLDVVLAARALLRCVQKDRELSCIE